MSAMGQPAFAKDDHRRVRLRGLDAQIQGIAHKIGNVMNLGQLIVMGEDDRLALLFQLLYLINEFHQIPPE
jgi:hypothetical protein